MLKKAFFILLFVFFFTLVNFLYADKVINRIIAIVNGEIITLYDLEKEMKSFYLYNQGNVQPSKGINADFFLQKLVDEILLKEEADRLKIEVSDDEINKRIEIIKEQQGLTDEEFKKLLKNNHMSLDELKEKIKTNMKITRLLKIMVYDKIIVTPQEVKRYYESHKELYNSPKRVGLRIIVMKDKNELMRLKDMIEKGKISFEEAARLYSIGPAASSGGDLGVLRWDELKPEFKRNLKGLKEGEISHVFNMGGQYIILQISKIFPSTHKSLQEVEMEIRKNLYKKKVANMLERYITELRKKAVMEIKI